MLYFVTLLYYFQGNTISVMRHRNKMINRFRRGGITYPKGLSDIRKTQPKAVFGFGSKSLHICMFEKQISRIMPQYCRSFGNYHIPSSATWMLLSLAQSDARVEFLFFSNILKCLKKNHTDNYFI